jgi:hypothetical protein
MRQRHDGVWYYEVNNFTAIVENVIPFFERFGFLSAKKKRDFSKFKQLAEMMRQGHHLTREGIEEILKVRLSMNDGGKRRYLDAEILKQFENPQRLYAGPAETLQDEIVRTVGRPTELGRNDQALTDPNL